MIAAAKIDKSRGKPRVEVVIGQAQQGRYIVRLWDKHGRKPNVIAEGVNWDNEPDSFLLDARSLSERILSWDVVVTALNPAPGQFYSVTVTITQDGEAVEGGIFEEKGKLDGTKAVLGMCMLSVFPSQNKSSSRRNS